jgi:hypothetical protein
MALLPPIVVKNGQLQQLQAGDTLNATAEGGEGYVLTNNEAGAIVIGTPVYSQAVDAAKKAQANASGTSRVLGLVADASITNGVSGNFKLDGVLTATTTQWDAVAGTTGGLTFGTIYYLSPTTAGQLTSTAPTTVGQYVVEIGEAISTTELLIKIKSPILL